MENVRRKPKSKKKGSNYRERITDASWITFKDFVNPWNFFYPFGCIESVIIEWMHKNGLLAVTLMCDNSVGANKFGDIMTLKQSSNLQGGQLLWRGRATK